MALVVAVCPLTEAFWRTEWVESEVQPVGRRSLSSLMLV